MRLEGTGVAPPPDHLSPVYSATMKRYEYSTVPLLTHATKQILDNWGQDGWELVTVIPGPNPEQLVAYMKREKE